MYKWINIKPKTQNFTLPVLPATVLFFPLWSGQRGPHLRHHSHRHPDTTQTTVPAPQVLAVPHRPVPRRARRLLAAAPLRTSLRMGVLPWLLWIHVKQYRSNTPFPLKIIFFLLLLTSSYLSLFIFFFFEGEAQRIFITPKTYKCYHSNSLTFQIHQEVINLFFLGWRRVREYSHCFTICDLVCMLNLVDPGEKPLDIFKSEDILFLLLF